MEIIKPRGSPRYQAFQNLFQQTSLEIQGYQNLSHPADGKQLVQSFTAQFLISCCKDDKDPI